MRDRKRQEPIKYIPQKVKPTHILKGRHFVIETHFSKSSFETARDENKNVMALGTDGGMSEIDFIVDFIDNNGDI